MTQLLRAVVVSSMFMSAAALAQDVEMNMNVQVDDEGMPSANIKMTVPDENGDEAGASVRVRGGGARMEVKVKAPAHVEVREERREFVEERRSPRPPPPAYREPEPAYRDCGTQRDPGCAMTRDGKYAMDGETFKGFLQSLRSVQNEITREEMSEKVLKRNYLTAAQLSLILDLFQNEITRLDVAKVAAPHVVNPQHALGFGSKWQNSISSEEYVELMAAQQD